MKNGSGVDGGDYSELHGSRGDAKTLRDGCATHLDGVGARINLSSCGVAKT